MRGINGGGLGQQQRMVIEMLVKEEVKAFKAVTDQRLVLMGVAMDRFRSESMARTFELRTMEDRFTVLVSHLMEDVYPLTPNPSSLQAKFDERMIELHASRREELRLRTLPGNETLVTDANGSDPVVTACVDEADDVVTVTMLVEQLPAAQAYQALHGQRFVEVLKRDAMGAARAAVREVVRAWEAKQDEAPALEVEPELDEEPT